MPSARACMSPRRSGAGSAPRRASPSWLRATNFMPRVEDAADAARRQALRAQQLVEGTQVQARGEHVAHFAVLHPGNRDADDAVTRNRAYEEAGQHRAPLLQRLLEIRPLADRRDGRAERHVGAEESCAVAAGGEQEHPVRARCHRALGMFVELLRIRGGRRKQPREDGQALDGAVDLVVHRGGQEPCGLELDLRTLLILRLPVKVEQPGGESADRQDAGQEDLDEMPAKGTRAMHLKLVRRW